MRFYQPHSKFYCGVDLHSKSMCVCVINRGGEMLVHQRIRNDANAFLKLIDPYQQDLVVSVECISNWYWLADWCDNRDLEFLLGHALCMKAIHGSKTKNDRIDSEKIAKLTTGGLFPMAYVYPHGQRSLRDLLRRRLRFTRSRAELYTHIHIVNGQANLPGVGQTVQRKTKRSGLPGRFDDEHVRLSVTADLKLVESYDQVIRELEKHILDSVYDGRHKEMSILRSMPGLGQITAMTILLEMDTVKRFSTRQRFASYSRSVKPASESDGARYGFRVLLCNICAPCEHDCFVELVL